MAYFVFIMVYFVFAKAYLFSVRDDKLSTLVSLFCIGAGVISIWVNVFGILNIVLFCK